MIYQQNDHLHRAFSGIFLSPLRISAEAEMIHTLFRSYASALTCQNEFMMPKWMLPKRLSLKQKHESGCIRAEKHLPYERNPVFCGAAAIILREVPPSLPWQCGSAEKTLRNLLFTNYLFTNHRLFIIIKEMPCRFRFGKVKTKKYMKLNAR